MTVIKILREPTPAPTEESRSQALEVLENQFLHVWQVLFFNGYASPDNAFLLKVGREQRDPRWLNAGIEVKTYNANKTGLRIVLRGTESDKEIFHKAQMLLDGQNLEKPHCLACCPYAVRRNC